MSPVRLATVEDISKIVDLVESVYRGESATKGWTSESDILDGQRTDAAMIRVLLPFHLRTIAKIAGEVEVEIAGEVTPNAIVDAIETRFPMLRGTIRDHGSRVRRPFLRYYACERDFTLESPDAALQLRILRGQARCLRLPRIKLYLEESSLTESPDPTRR